MSPRSGRNVFGANPLSFFSVSNLYTIDEISQYSKSMGGSLDVEVSSAFYSEDKDLTALPRWEGIQIPKRALTRHGSRDRILEKETFAKEAELGTPGEGRSGASTPYDEEKPRHSRTVVWLVLIVVIVLAIAIILGAVLGTFVHPGGDSLPQPSVTEIPASATPSPTSTSGGGDSAEETPTSAPIARIQSFAATGWNVPGSEQYYTVWLFAQDDDGYLSSHSFNSSTGNWTRVSNFASAKKGTPLAAAAFQTEYYKGQSYYDLPNARFQASVIYLDNNNYLREWTFPDSGPEIGLPGSLTDQKYIAHEKTSIAFYWPSVVYQGLSGELREAQFECLKAGECWNDNVLKTTQASNGTQLVRIPMGNELSSSALFYQEEDGTFVAYKEDNDQPASVWETQAFSDLVPRNASIAAFATTRAGDKEALNAYLIWQNGNGIAQMSWTDNRVGWRGPITDSAFVGADNHTALACSSGLTFPKFALPAGTELSHCYFQTGAAVREVRFDGKSWKVVSNVPTFGF